MFRAMTRLVAAIEPHLPALAQIKRDAAAGDADDGAGDPSREHR